MAVIFDGKAFAGAQLIKLSKDVSKLKEKGIIPKLVVVQVGKNQASTIFVNEKRKAAEKIGIQLEVRSVKFEARKEEIAIIIKNLNKDLSVHGVMIQLPLPKTFSKEDRDRIINAIDPKKDVDGMRDDSPFVAPVVRAVLSVIKEAKVNNVPSQTRLSTFGVARRPLKDHPCKIVVVGAKGFVGKKILNELRSENLPEQAGQEVRINFDLIGVDMEIKDLKSKIKRAGVLISATGQEGLIKGDMVKPGAVVIDVGSPKGDVVTDEVAKKVNFISPVPGGVGPLTVLYLLENTVQAVKKLDFSSLKV